MGERTKMTSERAEYADGDVNSLGLAKSPAETRVVVAMSGGVDSSVVAALLAGEGYAVTGITLQLYDYAEATHRRGACCAGQDIHDARRIAEHLRIPHFVLDYEARFRDKVIDAFATSYVAGETPIPCVACNQHIKFADLLDTALDLGADVLATGHYVASRPHDGRRALFRAEDTDRDQSYFLYATTAAQLDVLRFPLGERPKAEVRALARELGLAVADKPDSQDICFVPSGRYTDVIERLRPGASTPGAIVHVDGRSLGRHQGVIHFTVGQRKGLGLRPRAGEVAEPLYVVRLEAASARVIVGPRAALETHRLVLRDVNWLGDAPLDDGEREIAVRVRSTRAPSPAVLARIDGRIEVSLVEADIGVSPGQACVFYDTTGPRARVLGGGVIASAHARSQPVSAHERVAP